MSRSPASSRVDATPAFASAILGWGGTAFLARLALCGAYLLGGVVKLTDFHGAVAEQAHFGMPHPALFAMLTIAVELIGPALVLSGRLVWLGAGMLGVFTGLAAITANAFWTMHGPERFGATNAFFEHLGLIGGFVLTAIMAERRPSGS
ncbi:DoxX family protein [Novosphingobium terrae]|uniref:DoxX family protein n=1 Tax=Novosphingobium terrae TaxID=2726189 RepID=UPI0019822681|nr:DoxX family protein [Novosphingobium terrae]